MQRLRKRTAKSGARATGCLRAAMIRKGGFKPPMRSMALSKRQSGGLKSALRCGIRAAESVEGGADDAAGVARAFAAGVEAGNFRVLEGVVTTRDAHG